MDENVYESLVSEISGAIVLWRVSDWRPGFRFSKKHYRQLFTFGMSIVGTRFLNFFNRRSDDLLIGFFLGTTALGYYTIAYRLLLMITRLLLNVINAVALPAFSRLQHDSEKMRQGFYTATQYSCLIAFPAFLGLSAIAPELIPALHGAQWGPSIPVLQVLGLSGILLSLFFFNNPVIVAAGKPSWQLVLTAVQAVASVIVFTVSVQWGIVAVAAGFMVRGYLTSPVSLWMLNKLIGVKPLVFVHQSVRPLVGSMVMVAAVYGVRQILGGWLSLYPLLAASVLLGMVLYVMTIILIAPELTRQAVGFVRLILPQRDPAPANRIKTAEV